MKRTITPVVMVLALMSPLTAQDSISKSREAKERQVLEYYNQAEKAYSAGNLTAAKVAVQNALKINRNHGPSTALAIKLNKSSTTSSFQVKAREKKFSSVIVPIIDFEDLPLEDALRTLALSVEKNSNEEVIPNFVIQDPSGTLKLKEVTLNMKQVPAHVVLNYLMDLTGGKAKFDQYAIVIRPAN